MKYFRLELEKEDHTEAKAVAAMTGKTMQEFFRETIRERLDRERLDRERRGLIDRKRAN